MKRAIVVAVAGLAAVGIGVFFLTRPSADVDRLGGYATRGWGGAHPASKSTPPNRYGGTGTVIAAFTAHNVRDHAVKLSLAKADRDELATRGIRADVRFFAASIPRGYGDFSREADLARGTATMPAHAEGEIVHIFHVDRCPPPRTSFPATLALEVDGHPARAMVTHGGGDEELQTYERQLHDIFGWLDLAC